MKLLRGCWYSLMAGFLLAGLVTGRREFFLLLFIMGFILLYSLCINIWTARSFCYLQEVEKKVCVKGDQTYMRVFVTNDKPFPFSLMRITIIPVVRSQKARERFSLPPGSSITFTVPLACPYRGIYNVGISTLEINDSFGLVRTTFNILDMPYYRHVEVKVYPQLTELGALPAAESDPKFVGKRYAEQGESYAGLRPYRPGDSLKRIHRAVSARRHEWFVRTYDLPLETSVIIVLDTVTAHGTQEDGLYLSDLCCQCAAAIARYSLKAGYRVIYRDASLDSAFVLESANDFQRLYDRLAELDFEADDGSTGRFPQLAAGQLTDAQAVYIVSARGGDGIEEVFSSSAVAQPQHNVKLIAVHSGAPTAVCAGIGRSALLGVQIIPVMVGDDVATALGIGNWEFGIRN